MQLHLHISHKDMSLKPVYMLHVEMNTNDVDVVVMRFFCVVVVSTRGHVSIIPPFGKSTGGYGGLNLHTRVHINCNAHASVIHRVAETWHVIAVTCLCMQRT